MCTALSLTTKDHYFGRNLDLDRSYGEEVCVMPRRFPLTFRKVGQVNSHFAIIGMATVVENDTERSFKELGGLPLFYDGTNEHGLSAAGLNFPGNAYYAPLTDSKESSIPGDIDSSISDTKNISISDGKDSSISGGKDNIAPFEFIPWILCRCKSVKEARVLLSRMNIADIAFSKEMPPTPLHWIISDRDEDIVVEAMRDGLHIHENHVGVLTNNPPFEYQVENLQKIRHLRNDNREVPKENRLSYSAYSNGLGAVGLPGDVSSTSRFVRAVFGRKNSVSEKDELSSVSQFFHLLSSVEVTRGVCKTDEGTLHVTVYSSCVNTDRGLYYYTTYDNRQITCVDMHKTELSGERLSRFKLLKKQSIQYQN